MKFGIFYEHQLPRPWSADSEHRLLQESLTQIELADRLGYDYAWEVEHHFLEEYSHSSAPEVFLGAASQRTKRIRLGHGIIQLPTNHPIRVAERVATLDLLSGGRVELGLGEGQGPIELHPFGRRVRDKRDVWEEAVQVMVQCFTRDAVEFHGSYFDFPARNVIPKPFQKPHPPLWVACSNISTIGSAGQWGMGALGFQFVTPEAARAWVHRVLHQPDPAVDQARRLPDESQRRHGERVHVRAHGRRGAGEGGGLDVLRVLPLHYGRNGMASRGGEHVGALPGMAAHAEGAGDAARRG